MVGETAVTQPRLLFGPYDEASCCLYISAVGVMWMCHFRLCLLHWFFFLFSWLLKALHCYSTLHDPKITRGERCQQLLHGQHKQHTHVPAHMLAHADPLFAWNGKKYNHSHAWISAHTFNSQRVNVGLLLWASQQYNVGGILGGTAPVGACSSVPEYCPVKSHKGHQWVWWLGNLATCQRHRAKLWQKDKTSVFDVNIANPGRVRPLHLLRSPSLHVFDRAALQRHFDRHSRNKRKRGRGKEEA